MIKEEIKKVVGRAVNKLYPDFNGRENKGIDFSVEKPKEATHGDYSTNIALLLSKQLKKNPNEIALFLAPLLEKNNTFKKVEVVGGFINFFINEKFFNENITQILKEKDLYGKKLLPWFRRAEKVIIEYTDPNPFKEFHIGHLMSNSIGESLSRIIEFGGAKVKRACYQGDVGLHVAKAIWGKVKNSNFSWQEAYVSGTESYQQDELAKKEIIDLNKKIFQRSDKKVNAIYDEGKKWSLAYFENIYKKLGTKFDYYFFESQVAGFGERVVWENLGKVFEKGENGAVIFKGEKFGLHTRVFINSEGLPTYEAKDLALPQVKYSKYKYDKSVIVTASEQNDYFNVMLCALKQTNPDLAQKTTHIGHGMMRLPEGKMSSRTGKVITFESLLKEVEKLVAEKIATRDFSDAEKSRVAEAVAIGALKYSILKQSIGSDIIYDFDKSIAFEGDSGPYLQYSLARAISVLNKAKQEKIKGDPNLQMHPNDPNHATSDFAKMMYYFTEIVQKAGKELEPHIIALYLIELAREFNAYYANNKIVDRADEFSPYKIALTEAFSIIMQNGLWLLGIPALDKM